MNKEFRPDPSFKPWGPFISKEYKNEPITVSDIITASVIWGTTILCILLAIYLAYGQTKASRSSFRSTYVWMIWLELLVSFVMGLECYLHLLKLIKPSFAFYFTILFWWCIQVQLLLQIIINRIRVIVPDRRRSKHIMIGTAAIVTAINISVFNIWIPARLQTSERYKAINDIWDRIEKALYLFIDASLNWYFLRVVQSNLINNGLQKYNKLLSFNRRIIILSLLMDVMIIAAMSIPNSFLYIQFHPLAYIVKLNIEMIMANLIKRIAISKSRRTGNPSIVQEFASDYNKSSTNNVSAANNHPRNSIIELSANVFSGKRRPVAGSKSVSFETTGKQIRKTEEISVRSEPNPDYEGEEEDRVEQMEMSTSKSSDDTEGGGSFGSEEVPRRQDSDEEAILVMQGKRPWGRLRN